MCLYVDTSFHKSNTASVATRDILVWKVLKLPNNIFGFAPFQGCKWHFGFERSSKLDYWNRVVDAGLHAKLSKTAARRYVRCGLDNVRVFPAIIPKGSKLFFGRDRDIVATQMIVYKDLAAVEANHGPIAPKVPKKLLVA